MHHNLNLPRQSLFSWFFYYCLKYLANANARQRHSLWDSFQKFDWCKHDSRIFDSCRHESETLLKRFFLKFDSCQHKYRIFDSCQYDSQTLLECLFLKFDSCRHESQTLLKYSLQKFKSCQLNSKICTSCRHESIIFNWSKFWNFGRFKFVFELNNQQLITIAWRYLWNWVINLSC